MKLKSIPPQTPFGQSSGKRGFPSSKCRCGGDVSIYTAKTEENPGRPFYRCETFQDDHLFKWVEESVFEEVVEAVPKLGSIENEVSNLKAEFELMKEVIHALNQDVMEVKSNSQKWKIGFGCCLCTLIVVIAIYVLM